MAALFLSVKNGEHHQCNSRDWGCLLQHMQIVEGSRQPLYTMVEMNFNNLGGNIQISVLSGKANCQN